MCIIAVKKPGIAMPKDRVINKMFTSNSDGAGYMIKKQGNDFVTIRKGFMTLEDFNESIKKEDIDIQDIVVMHFRIATVSGKGKNLTHPFIANKTKDIAESLFAQTKEICFAHNGTLSDYSSIGVKELRSDTSVFASLIMSSSIVSDYLTSPVFKLLFESHTKGNRFAIINPAIHDVFIFGEWSGPDRSEYKWNTGKDGIIYSNHSYECNEVKIYGRFSDELITVKRYSNNIHETKSNPPYVNDSNKELMDDDSNQNTSTMSVFHILDDVGELSKEDYDSFLEFIGMRKSQFVKKVKSGDIGLSWYTEKCTEWLESQFPDTTQDGKHIEYKSGVIITDNGKKAFTVNKKKEDDDTFCQCCGTEGDLLRACKIKLYKIPTSHPASRQMFICNECCDEYGDFYGVDRKTQKSIY